jgi:hypothetical protein
MVVAARLAVAGQTSKDAELTGCPDGFTFGLIPARDGLLNFSLQNL